MHRLLAALVVVLLLAVAAVWLFDRRSAEPVATGSPPTADQPQGVAPATAATGGTVALRADAPNERSEVAATRTSDSYVVRGFVLADARAPDLTSVRVLAYRGEAHDSSGLLSGIMAGAQRQAGGPAFVLEGNPIAETAVAAGGSFELRTTIRDLRITIDHDLYLQPMPEVVHVSAETGVAEIVLSPLLGGCLRGKLLGPNAAGVERVRLSLEPDPLAVMRDSRAMMSAIAASTKPPAVPRNDGSFVFRGVSPGASITLTVEGGGAAGRRHEAGLQPGEVRDVVLPVDRGAAVTVEVVDGKQLPIADARVSLRPAAATGMAAAVETHHQRTGADGTCSLHGLFEGRYHVDASAQGLATASTSVELSMPAPDEPTPNEPTPNEPTLVRLVLGEGGVVTGTVVAPDGSPVEDARVAHQPSMDIPLLGELSKQLGPEILAKIAEHGARTDANGRFRLAGLADEGAFLVVAAHPGYAAGIASGVHMGDTDVVVELQPLATVTGIVIAEHTSAPLTEFTVSLLRTSFLVLQMPVRREVVREAGGAFRMAGVAIDSYTLQIEADGYSTFEKSINVPEGALLDLGTLSVPRAARVRGIVRSEQGEPIRGALVRKRRGAMADNPMLAMFQGSAASAYSDAEGRFDLGPLPPGRLQLLANAEDFASGRSEQLQLEAGQILDDVVIELGHGGAIRGRLALGPGQRIEDFLLLAQHQVTQNSQSPDFDPDGTFLIQNLDPGGYQVQAMPQQLLGDLGGAGDWQPGKGMDLGEMIRKMTDNAVSQRCTVKSGETTEITLDVRDIALGAQWNVAVEIGGKPLANGLIEATSLDDGTLRVAMMQDGTATFGRMQPGRHRLQVRAGITMTPVGEPQDLEYPTGAKEHRSTLRLPGGELRGRIVDAKNGEPLRSAIVRLQHDGHNERDDLVGMCLSDGDGQFVFTGLADGDYSLIAAEPLLSGADNSASRRSGIHVVAGTTNEPIELRSQPAASASVLVTGANGQPLSGATVLCVDEQGRPLGSFGMATTGDDGRAWFGGMANGTARVVGRAPGHAPGASIALQLAPDQATEFTLVLSGGAPTSLSVINATGQRLRGATLTARYEQSPWLPAMLLVQQVAGDGSFDLGRLGAGTWQFRVTHPAFGTIVQERAIQGSSPVTIVVTGS